MSTRTECGRETGCGPLGSDVTSASPNNGEVPKFTPGPTGIGDYYSSALDTTNTQSSMQMKIEHYEIAILAIQNSRKVIKLYNQVIDGVITYKKAHTMMKVVGNAYEGLTDEGRKTHIIIQEAIKEVEKFEIGEEGIQAGKLLIETIVGDQISLEKKSAEIEIQRQLHFIRILERKYPDPRPPSQYERVLKILSTHIGM